MSGEPAPAGNSAIQELAKAVKRARDPQIMRIVALVDTMMRRGPVDLLIEPLRKRLATLRPPRPLRFDRLMFFPLDLLIMSPARWRPGQPSIPRTALMPMAEHVRLTMGATAAAAIVAEIAGRTTADTELIARLGRSLWPVASAVLAGTAVPQTWNTTELGVATYRPLANAVAPLLAEAVTLHTMRCEAATGLLPPSLDAVEIMLSRVARRNETARTMMIAVLLDCLPEAAELLTKARPGYETAATQAAMDNAADLLLRQLDQDDTTEMRIAAGSLADAGAAVGRIVTLLEHLDTPNATPRRYERLRAVRRRLDASCKARFASGLEDDLLAPLQIPGVAPADIPALETAARGLRVLETEGRLVGSGSTYDLLLRKAADAIKDDAMLDRLSRADQVRLIEILRGPDAALAMLNQRP